MIWFGLAWALTPDDLAAAAERAEEQLATCVEVRCSDATGGEAAFVVAVHRYVASGVADGTLAATVRDRTPERFAALPQVLQEAATVPLAWGTWPASSAEVEAPPSRPTPPPDVDGDAVALVVRVVDAQRRPIPWARVRTSFDEEDHLVNWDLGEARFSVLYRDDLEWVLQRGHVVRLDVVAPGSAPQSVNVVMSRRRETRVEVALVEPWEPRFDDTLQGRATADAWAHWAARQEQLEATRSLDVLAEEARARRNLAVAARDWLDAGGGDVARDVCRFASPSRAVCRLPFEEPPLAP